MADQVVVTVIKIIAYIYKWHGEYQDSNGALKTMMTTVGLVKDTVSALNTEQHKELENPLRALMDCLNETKDILVANAKKKGKIMQFLFPKSITDQIDVLENRIHKLVSILNLAVSVKNLHVSGQQEKKLTALDFINDEETKRFWRSSFGESVFTVKLTDLEKALMTTYADFVDADALADLRLRLDNLKTGFVSCHRLSDFSGNETLSRRLQAYTDKKHAAVPPPSPGPGSPSLAHDVTFPLLLWVDDKPENNTVEIEYARQKGICVVVLNSTSEAKQWIIRHPDILEEENPNRVRMITDNAREGAETALDINAGEDMIRFVRGRRSTVPIMVYCGNLDFTKYTHNYKECTAANKRTACQAYIDQLNAK